MSVKYEPNNTKALLTINPVEIQDEASYKCEITYLEVRESCDVVQIIRLQTLGESYINFACIDLHYRQSWAQKTLARSLN